MPDVPIDAALAARLVAAQFPRWAHLPVRPVPVDGWDHRSFRLGDGMTLRLPSAVGYTPQGRKEFRWLPVLAPHLPLPVPTPLARGRPGPGYPYRWSVFRWLDGEDARTAPVDDRAALARDLAAFLAALHRIDPGGGPPPGPHSAMRGGPLTTFDAETRAAITQLGDRVDRGAATAIWEDALAAPWSGPPAWFHGDVAAGNLLVRDGRLAAVIDFGCAGVGDPACDLTIAWTLFAGQSRARFRAGLPHDPPTWARAAGWALWKALITLARRPDPGAERVVDDLLGEGSAG